MVTTGVGDNRRRSGPGCGVGPELGPVDPACRGLILPLERPISKTDVHPEVLSGCGGSRGGLGWGSLSEVACELAWMQGACPAKVTGTAFQAEGVGSAKAQACHLIRQVQGAESTLCGEQVGGRGRVGGGALGIGRHRMFTRVHFVLCAGPSL